jgi:hypothetical protein
VLTSSTGKNTLGRSKTSYRTLTVSTDQIVAITSTQVLFAEEIKNPFGIVSQSACPI